MKILPYHAIFGHRSSGGTVVSGDKSFILNQDQFQFFLDYRWFMMTANRQQLVSPSVTAWFDQQGFLKGSASSKDAACTPEDVLRLAISTWRPLLDTHEIYPLVLVERSVALVCLIERAVFTLHAPRIISLAAEKTTDFDLKSTLFGYSSEEHGHHIGLAHSLGIAPEDLEDHEATDGFLALILALESLALQRPLSLLVCMSLFETWRKPKGDGVFASVLGDLTGIDIEPFIAHAALDFDEQHGEKWRPFVTACSKGECNLMLQDLHRIKHLIDAWNDSIISYGSRVSKIFKKVAITGPFTPSAILNRRPCCEDFI